MNYWLVKSEPSTYSWENLLKDGKTSWDGVRNFAARNHLRSMKKGDLALFYHSNEGKSVVGIAKVSKEAYQDPTTKDPNWIAVGLEPHKNLKKPVSLEQIKAEKKLQSIYLVRQGRLSVMPLSAEEFNLITKMGS